jgi:hypothetical protein
MNIKLFLKICLNLLIFPKSHTRHYTEYFIKSLTYSGYNEFFRDRRHPVTVPSETVPLAFLRQKATSVYCP